MGRSKQGIEGFNPPKEEILVLQRQGEAESLHPAVLNPREG
jgi:hypothetical protein